MTLDPTFYQKLDTIEWFSNCGGLAKPEVGFPVHWVSEKGDALQLINTHQWADAKTEAQGDLTGYLAKHHNQFYGGHWNKLAKESREIIARTAARRIEESLETHGLERNLLQVVILDLNRAALESAYLNRFRGVPVFFGHLMTLYAAGHLPCGWDGNLDQWPNGNLVAL